MSLRVVAPVDDEPHAASEALGWSESYSFHVVHPMERLALLTRIGVRPNEGIMDVGLDVYPSDGGLLAARHVRPIEDGAVDLEVEGVKYEMIDPLVEWRISYDGPAHSLRSSRDASSHDAWHKSRLERLFVDLTFRAEALPAALDSAPDRFGQPGRFTGQVWISGDEYSFDVPGVRERTWGESGVVLPELRRRMWVRFDDGRGLVLDRRVEGGASRTIGWAVDRGTELRSVTESTWKTEPEPDGYWQRAMDVVAVDDRGNEWKVRGDVLQLAPLPTVRGKVQAVVVSSVVLLQCGDAKGLGIVEYLHQLDGEGQPLRPIAQWG